VGQDQLLLANARDIASRLDIELQLPLT